MSVRNRDVSAEELDQARAALLKAKKSGKRPVIDHASEVVNVLRAAHREQFVELGLRHDRVGIGITDDSGQTITSGSDVVLVHDDASWTVVREGRAQKVGG